MDSLRLNPSSKSCPVSIIATANAPKAIGTYSQAVKVGNTVYVSGQIPLDPATGELVQGPMEVAGPARVRQSEGDRRRGRRQTSRRS